MKPLILVKFLFLSILLYGQSDTLINSNLDFVSKVKAKLFKNIILSKELQSDKRCKMVVIPSLSIGFEKLSTKENLIPYKIRNKDTLTLQKLRKILPSNYWIYQEDNDLYFINEMMDFIDHYLTSDSCYIFKEHFERGKNYNFTDKKKTIYTHYCNDGFDIIKIYEPFDKWVNLYYKGYIYDYDNIKAIIPVEYESLGYDNSIIVKEKHLIYKLKMDEFVITKEVISD